MPFATTQTNGAEKFSDKPIDLTSIAVSQPCADYLAYLDKEIDEHIAWRMFTAGLLETAADYSRERDRAANRLG